MIMIINNDDIKLLHIQLNINKGAFVILQFNNLLNFNIFINYKKEYLIIEDKLLINNEIIKIDTETLSVSINCEEITNDKRNLREIKLKNFLNKMIK